MKKQHFIRSTRSAVSFFRLPNLLLIVLLSWVIRFRFLQSVFQPVGIEFTLSDAQFWFLVLDLVMVTLIGYWLNDWHDREIDRINRPNRFLVRHSIPTREFYLMIGSLLAIVVILSIRLAIDTHNLEKVLLLPISLLLLAAYAKWFKQYKYVGNALVSLLIVAILGLMVIAELPSINLMNDQNEFKFFQLLSLVSALIFSANLLREWAKDAQDMDGDMAHGVKSIPILIGLKQTQILIVLGFIGLITLQASIFPYLDQSMLSRVVLLFSVIVLIAALVVLILKNARWPELISKLLKLFMLGGIGQIAFFTIY